MKFITDLGKTSNGIQVNAVTEHKENAVTHWVESIGDVKKINRSGSEYAKTDNDALISHRNYAKGLIEVWNGLEDRINEIHSEKQVKTA